MGPKMIHGYWQIRGLGQPVRFLLEHAGADYEDKRYPTGPAPDFDKSEWLAVKPKLGLDFPNLPYLIDGEVKLTQTHAIMRYLGRKFNLAGATEQERMRCDMAEQQMADLRGYYVQWSYTPQPKHGEMKAAAMDAFKGMLKGFSQFLGSHHWMAGATLTHADFLCYEIFYQLAVLDKSLFDGAENLLAYNKRFEELPKIAAYLKSDRYLKEPFNNNMATWGARA